MTNAEIVIDGTRYVMCEAYGIEDEEWLDQSTSIVGPLQAKVNQAKLWELRLKNCIIEPKDLDIKKIPKRILERLKASWIRLNELDRNFLLELSSEETQSQLLSSSAIDTAGLQSKPAA